MTKTYYSDAGKGSHARKQDISNEEYRNNFDRIFGKKEKVESEESGCSTTDGNEDGVPVGE